MTKNNDSNNDSNNVNFDTKHKVVEFHKNGTPKLIRFANKCEIRKGFKKGSRVKIKDTEDLDEVYNFARGETGTVICMFPAISEQHIALLVSLDKDKGKWPVEDEGELFSDYALELINDIESENYDT